MPRPKKDGRYQKRSDAYWINSSLLYRASEVFYNEVLKIRKKKACEDILEYKDYSWRGKHTKIFKLKEGCKIKVSAG